MNCEEIHLADLIQEANVALLEALEQEKPQVKNDQWLRLQLRKGILAAIEEQTERKFQDDSLVARVEKLESAVKELTDDDGETRFTLDELAVILDMKTDEIRDVLRLTGDDKYKIQVEQPRDLARDSGQRKLTYSLQNHCASSRSVYLSRRLDSH